MVNDGQGREAPSRLVAALANGAQDNQGQLEAIAPEREFLLARIASDFYAVPIEYLTEVLAHSKVTPIPHVPAHVLGIVAHHGVITAVLDLALYCGKEREENPKRLLVLSSRDLQAAVPVSDVLGIRAVAADKVQPPLPHMQSSQGFVSGQITWGAHVFSVIDVEILLSSSRHRKGKESRG